MNEASGRLGRARFLRLGWFREMVSANLTIYESLAALSSATQYASDPARAGIGLPAIVIGRPKGSALPERIGAKPYLYEIPVTFYSDLDRRSAYDEQAEMIEAFVEAVDADHMLDDAVEEAVVSEWGIPTANRDTRRPTLSTTATVAAIITI